MCHFDPQILLAKANNMVMSKVKEDEKCHLSDCLGSGEKLKISVTISNAYLSLIISAVWKNRSVFPIREAENGVQVGYRYAWLNFLILLKRHF